MSNSEESAESGNANVPVALLRILALMTDPDVMLCLNGVIKGFLATSPDYEGLIGSPTRMTACIIDALPQDSSLFQQKLPAAKDDPKAARVLLFQMASNPDLRRRLESWLKSARPTLLEPITSALVLAGIIVVLSSRFKLKYHNKGGKREFSLQIDKKATPTDLLKKFFALLSS